MITENLVKHIKTKPITKFYRQYSKDNNRKFANNLANESWMDLVYAIVESKFDTFFRICIICI